MILPVKTTACPLFLVLLIISTLITGCAKYKVQHVTKKEKIVHTFEVRKDNADLTIRAFDQDEFKDYLSAYQPIHLHIKNKTAYPQELAAKNISLPIASLESLKKQEPKIFAINFIPCALTTALGIVFWWEFVIPTTLILGLGAAHHSIRQHERTIKYLKKNTLFPNEHLTIQPFSSIDTLIFAKRTDYTPRFTITLTTPKQNSSTTFNVFVTARTVNAYHVTQ